MIKIETACKRAVEDVGPYKSCLESYAKMLFILYEKKNAQRVLISRRGRRPRRPANKQLLCARTNNIKFFLSD